MGVRFTVSDEMLAKLSGEALEGGEAYVRTGRKPLSPRREDLAQRTQPKKLVIEQLLKGGRGLAADGGVGVGGCAAEVLFGGAVVAF
jgi:hypothetical protein